MCVHAVVTLIAITEKRLDEAKEHFISAVTLDTQSPERHYNLAYLCALMGDGENARKVCCCRVCILL